MDEAGEKAYYLWLEARDKVKELEGKIEEVLKMIREMGSDPQNYSPSLLLEEIKKILEK